MEKELKCYFCAFNQVVHKHHIIPKSQGGTNEEENLIELCPNCHAVIHKGLYFLYWSEGIYYLVNQEDHEDIVSPVPDLGYSDVKAKKLRDYPKKSIKQLPLESEKYLEKKRLTKSKKL